MKKTFIDYLTNTFPKFNTSFYFYNPSKDFVSLPKKEECLYSEVNFKSKNGNRLNGWFLKPETSQIKGTILFFHGNSDNISLHYNSVIPLIKNGYQALAFDYQGFGKSEGVPNQENLLNDGYSALDYLLAREDVQNKKLLLYGQSLGGHLAVVVASRRQEHLDALVIEGAFSSHLEIAKYSAPRKYYLPSFFADLFVTSAYDAINEIETITIPKLIIHSENDETVPFQMGKELFNKAREPKNFWPIKGPHLEASKLYEKEFVEKVTGLLKDRE